LQQLPLEGWEALSWAVVPLELAQSLLLLNWMPLGLFEQQLLAQKMLAQQLLEK